MKAVIFGLVLGILVGASPIPVNAGIEHAAGKSVQKPKPPPAPKKAPKPKSPPKAKKPKPAPKPKAPPKAPKPKAPPKPHF